jgi:CRP-like cAMP-binding protein
VKNGVEVKRLSSKDYFGEISILFQTKRALSINSLGNTVCFQISQSLLQEILGENFRDVILKTILMDAFNNSKIMKHMIMETYFDKLYSLFKINFSKNQQIVIPSEHYKERKIVVLVQGTLLNVFLINIECHS